jgi:hypothetical protein
MNRIEEIKKRCEEYDDEYFVSREEVEYLLSKLKQAEEDIQTAYDYISQTDRVIHKRQLLNALKSIRED